MDFKDKCFEDFTKEFPDGNISEFCSYFLWRTLREKGVEAYNEERRFLGD